MPTDSSRIATIHTATDGRDMLENTPDGWEVERPGLWWDGPADGEGMGPWGNPPPGADDAAPGLRGLALSTVTRCLELTADPVAGMPWKVYRGRAQVDTPAWIVDPQAVRVDGRRLTGPGPSARLSPVEFWSQTIVAMLNYGEGIVYTPRMLDAAGEPSGAIVPPIYNLHPLYVNVDETGRYYVDDELEETGRGYIDPREMIVIRNIVMPGHVRGVGVLQAHAGDLQFAANIRDYADNLYQRGVPNGYLKSTQPKLDAAGAAELKRVWLANHGGVKKTIGVLNATTEFHPLSIDPSAGAITDLVKLGKWGIIEAYGLPVSKFGLSFGTNHSYANLEQENAEYVNDTLMRIARRVEAAIDPVLPAGQSLKIDFRQLLRADTATRFALYQSALTSGWMTVDEVRDLEDLPPLPAPAPPVDDVVVVDSTPPAPVDDVVVVDPTPPAGTVPAA
jgi:HK97 family phage portal protein